MIPTLTVMLTGTRTLEIEVRVLKARQMFNRMELLIEPIAGTGQAWVTEEKVSNWERRRSDD